MFSRFIYLKEDSKFFIIASIVCALIILITVILTPGCANTDSSGGYWAQIISSIRQ